MTLIVEDGSGISNAQTYVSVADVFAYAVQYGLTAPANPNVSIMLAMRYLEGSYYDRWVGHKRSDAQALSWPRTYAVRRDGWAVSESAIPREVKDAVCALALRSAGGENLTPDITRASKVKKEQIGPIMVEYADGAPVYSIYKDIDFILTSLLTPRTFAKILRT